MPKVTKHVSQGRAKTPVRCARCPEPIVKGESYYKWAIKSQFGGTVYQQHTKHGPVRQSQLTHSKMSGAYAAIEGAVESLNGAGEVQDVRDALETCIGDIEGVRDEYQESLDNMPEGLQQGDVGQQIEEKVEQLQSFADELQSACDNIEDYDDDDVEKEDTEPSEDFQAHLQTQVDAAQEALDSAEF